MSTNFIPKHNKSKYNNNIIGKHPMSEIIDYFIKKNMELGIEKIHFNDRWWNKHGNRTAFWKMVELNSDIDYWKNIIDRMVDDDWVRENQFYSLKHVVDLVTRFKDKKDEELVWKDIRIDCQKRLNIGGYDDRDEPNPKLDKYFDENGLPTLETIEMFGVAKNFRFRQFIIENTDFVPKW